jgi:prepilin-type N-terminal cleavage/methylation domain-containing protein
MRARLPTQQGFTLTEVLMAMTIIGITLAPLTVGMTGVVRSTTIREELTALSNAARGKMEEVLAMGMVNIPLSNPPGSAGSLSDQVTIHGRSVQRTVIVDLADGNLPPDGIVDADFKKITVQVSGFELQSYLADKL